MSFSLPPIVKIAERLLVEIELAVVRFHKKFKYTVGTELRNQAMEVARLVHRAWRQRERQAYWLSQLVWAIDELKLRMQLAMRIRAFANFKQFDMLSRLAVDLGRQAGGWRKAQHPKRQSSAPDAARKRPQILSAQAASKGEAKP